jgi:hypothetical protein
MRKRFVRGVLVGSLLAGLAAPGPAVAEQPSAGAGNPLALAAHGVLLPYSAGGGSVSLVEVASPVQGNPNLHLVFFNAACARGGAVSLPETANDIGFVDVGSVVPAGQSGVVAIAGVAEDGATLVPLTSPIHARVYVFNALDGRSRVLEPIVLDTAESPDGPNTWSPLRTGATFFAPLQTATVNTGLTLICPIATIQDASGTALQQAFSTAQGFPPIVPTFPAASSAGNLRVRVYDANGNFLRDGAITCACLTELSVTAIDPIYSDAGGASNGTYTEIRVDPVKQNAFTGYRAVFTVGAPLNNFFGRLSDGSRLSIEGTLTPGAR